MLKLSGMLRYAAVAAAFSILLLAQPAALRADSLTAGGKTIRFDVPAGYVEADSSIYGEVISRITNALPQDMTLHSFYVEKGVDRKFRNGDTDYLEEYLMVASLGQVTRRDLSLSDFREFSDYLVNNQGGLFSEEVAAKARKAVEDATDGEIQLGNITSLGCFGITDASISYLAIMQQEVLTGEGTRMSMDQAVIMNTLLVEGKMLHINQYRTITDPDQALKFKDDSPAIVKSMNFKLGVSSGRSSSGAAPVSSLPRVERTEDSFRSFGRQAGQFIVAVLAAGGIGYFMRKRKKGKPGKNDGKQE